MNTMGIPLVQGSLTPIVSDLLSHYEYAFDEINYMGNVEQFSINYEVLTNPSISEDYLDILIRGELRRQFEECDLPLKPITLKEDKKRIQIVASDRVL